MGVKKVDFSEIELLDGFWKNRYALNSETSIYAVQKVFEVSGRFDALRFIEGNKNIHIFYDSDVAKWIEAVAYLIAKNPAKYADLEKFCDDLIDCMLKNQREDGYFNSYFQQIEPDCTFARRNDHELYCAGHIIEAAIAYEKYVKKGKLLLLAERYVALIRQKFMIERSTPFVTCGHAEIELALFALYEYTGKMEYKELAEFFVNQRGNNDLDEPIHDYSLVAMQDNLPARDLEKAEGHAVRATYYYSAMADAARICNDVELFNACQRLYEDIVDRKMYVTGGIGSTRLCESFTIPYDLPNLMAYTESCAAIGLIFFAQRMEQLNPNGKYADLIERVLYNGFLSSTSLDGKSFFYENPLEVCRKEKGKQNAVQEALHPILPIWKRKELFDCSCCPPNINRFVASIGNLIYMEAEEGVYVNQFIPSKLRSDVLEIKTKYPTENTVTISSKAYPYKVLYVRIPSWCDNFEISLNGENVDAKVENGYVSIYVGQEFVLDLRIGFSPRFIQANPQIRDNAGKVCLMNGPVVYCLEEIDNGKDLYSLYVNEDENCFESEYSSLYGLKTFVCRGERKVAGEDNFLYAKNYQKEKVRLKFIPYYAFANRGESDMIVWINGR